MPRLSADALPAYRLHKQSGQAIVTLSGKDILLGPHGTPESRAKYLEITGQWQNNGRQLPEAANAGATVAVLCAAYWKHA